MNEALKHYKAIISIKSNKSKEVLLTLSEDAENDYDKGRLPVIPAGTEIIADFGGDFGLYGVAAIDGVVHKVKVPLHEIHKLFFIEGGDQ